MLSGQRLAALAVVLMVFFSQMSFSGIHAAEAATPTFKGVATASGLYASGTSIDVDVPAGVTAGDLLIAQIGFNAAGSASITPPAGWTVIDVVSHPTQAIMQGLYWREATGGEPAQYSFTLTGGTDEAASGAILAYGGVDASDPIDAVAGQSNTAGTPVSAPSIVTTEQDTTLVALFSVRSDSAIAPHPGMTERWDVASDTTAPSDGEVASAAADELAAVAGPTGARTATVASETGSIGHLLALAPAPDPTYVAVNSTGDAADANPGDGSCATGGTNAEGDPECTLRAAIGEAEASAAIGEIRFDIPATDTGHNNGSGWWVIDIGSQLDWMDHPTILDGTTQTGYSGAPLIVVDGSSLVGNEIGLGFNATADDSSVFGLSVVGFPEDGISSSADRLEVEGNYIGVYPDGSTSSPNGSEQLVVSGTATDVRIRNNVIGGGSGPNIAVLGDVTGLVITGNAIGTDPTGTHNLGGAQGIWTDTTGVIRIGGTGVGDGNLIKNSASQGVHVAGTGSTVAILGNGIASNGDLGIDLSGDSGVTANDPSDADSGPNDLLNFPVITTLEESGGIVTVGFDLDVPDGSYRVEFFRNASADSSGHGEGESLAGSVDVVVAGGVPSPASTTFVGSAGEVIAATTTAGTTAPFGGTSEFSSAMSVLAVNGTPNAGDDPLGGVGGGGYEAAAMALSPVAYWRLGESVGPTADDAVGANDGTYNGPALGATGAFADDADTAAFFDGDDDYVDIGTLDVIGSGLTIAAWIKLDGTGHVQGRIVSKATGTAVGDHTWMFSVVDSGADLLLRSRVTASGTTSERIASGYPLQIGEWHFVAMTYDETDIVMYLDGELVDSSAHSVGGALDVDPGVSAWIGGNPSGATDRPFGGDIDDVAMFSRALTSTEIQTLQSAGRRNYTIDQGSSLVTSTYDGVLANDTDPDGDALTATIVAPPVNAAVFSLNANGSFTYTPDLAFSGTDTFTYEACDPSLACDAAVVTITVVPVPTQTVNSTGDAGDASPGDASCHTGGTNSDGDPECTLRAAIEEANATAGIDLISFAVPVTDSGYVGGVWVIGPGTQLPPLTQPVRLNGSTQPGWSGEPIIVLDGGGTISNGLDVDGGNSEIRGLVIHSFTNEGIDIEDASGNTIVSNWIGLASDGTTPSGNGDDGIAIRHTSNGNTIGGPLPSDRNVISGNGGEGILVESDGNTVEGNYLGTDVTGLMDVGNGDDGLDLNGGDNNNVVNNVISGNDGEGVQVLSADGNTFTGNLIGVGSDGATPVPNSGDGITLNFGDSTDVTIGGTAPGAGNTIAHNGDEGVSVFGSSTDDITGLGNSIHSNGGLGWDFGGAGVTANDAGDIDGGPNGHLNFPVVTSAISSGGTVSVDFDLDVPAGDYRIEFFSNTAADSSGYGEGETFVGSYDVTSHPGGSASYSASFAGSAGPYLTATTTEQVSAPYGATSEFSAVVAVVVIDVTPPVITLVGANPQEIEVGSPYVELGATALDDSDGDITGSIIIDAGAVNTSLPGSYLVTYNVTDSAGNAATQVARTVDVVVSTSPVISLLGPNPQVVQVGSPYVELGATASDAKDGDVTGSIVIDSGAVNTAIVGSFIVTYNVTDSDGNAATQVTRTVDVVDTNAPVVTLIGANPQTIEVGSPYVELGATAFDTYDGDLTGSIVVDAGAVNSSVLGSYSVTYDVSDSSGNAATQVVRTVEVVDTTAPLITLAGANPQTIVVGSSYVELGATATDVGDGDLSGLIAVDATAVNVSVLGSYAVTYNVSDSSGNSAAEVTRTVHVVNAGPNLDGLSNRTEPEGSAITFTATASDPDPVDPLLFSLSGAPPGASIDPASGVFTWVPGEADGPGVFSFQVVVSDGGTPALTDAQTITITVTEVNTSPAISAVPAQSGTEQTAIEFTASAADTDLPGNTLSFGLSGAPAGAGIDPVSGDFSWTPTEGQGPGTYVFDVVVTDDGSPSLGASTRVTVTVAEDNSAPTLTNPGPQVSIEGEAIALAIGAADSDDPPNTLGYAATGLPPGLTIDPGTGLISGAIDFDGSIGSPYLTTVTVTDDGVPAASAQTTFTWIVGDVNRLPTGGDDTYSIDEDAFGLFDVLSNDTDPDGDTVAVVGVGAPSHGVATLSGDSIRYVPDHNFFGVDSFTYMLSDGRGGLAATTANVTVTPVNDPPAVTAPTAMTISELNPISFDVVAVDIEDDSLSYALFGAPSGATIDSDGVFYWVPREADGPGIYAIDVVVSDDGTPARSTTRTVTIDVTELNAPPNLTNPGTQRSTEAEAVNLGLAAYDSDIPASVLHFSATGLPPGLSINPATGIISGTIPFDAAVGSPYSATVTVYDDALPPASDQVTFSWIVAETNRPPVATDITVDAEAGVPVVVTLSGSDPDGDAVTFAVATTPIQGSLAGGPRVLTYTPDVAAAGLDALTFSISDGRATATGTVSFNIVPNRAPIGVADEYVVRRGGTLLVEAPGVLSNDRDPEGEPITAAIVSVPSHGSISLGDDGTFTYENHGDDADLDWFTYRVDDGMRQSIPTTVRILIEDNVAPVAGDDTVQVDEDEQVSFTPLDNDSDANNEPVIVLRVTDAAHGTVRWTREGVFTYLPDPNWNGVDSFGYEITDGDLTGTGVVTVVVNPVNDPPSANTVVATGDSGGRLIIDLNGHVADVDGDALTFLLEAPPHGNAEQIEPGVFALDLDGVIRDLPALAFIATDVHGAHGTALLKVSIVIPGDLVGVPALVGDDVRLAAASDRLEGSDSLEGQGSLVAGLRLMIGSVLGTFQALRMPILVLLAVVLGSLYLGFSRRFAFSNTATPLPLGNKKRVDIVMAQSRAGVPAREDAGSHQRIVARFGPDETGITTTGARSMVRSEMWVEVETPEQDGWVNASFLTEQQPRAAFLEDDRARELIAQLVDQLYDSGDLLPITGGHDLHVAFFGPPVRFAAGALRRVLSAASVYWWWGADGDAPNTQATFAEIVGESFTAAYRSSGPHHLEPTIPVPIEFANMHSLVVGHHELGEAWRVFFRYEDGEPQIAGLMREAPLNPAAMHGMMVREDLAKY